MSNFKCRYSKKEVDIDIIKGFAQNRRNDPASRMQAMKRAVHWRQKYK